ncbi:hypothetical protein TWF481_002097 [Arthrobotrys musiformis]|uniref:Uncharacterized protein n=1 Tax=Arthrobotrys musiformis TaxID=47236 RepID=A0AAV9VSD5_9PEZI
MGKTKKAKAKAKREKKLQERIEALAEPALAPAPQEESESEEDQEGAGPSGQPLPFRQRARSPLNPMPPPPPRMQRYVQETPADRRRKELSFSWERAMSIAMRKEPDPATGHRVVTEDEVFGRNLTPEEKNELLRFLDEENITVDRVPYQGPPLPSTETDSAAVDRTAARSTQSSGDEVSRREMLPGRRPLFRGPLEGHPGSFRRPIVDANDPILAAAKREYDISRGRIPKPVSAPVPEPPSRLPEPEQVDDSNKTNTAQRPLPFFFKQPPPQAPSSSSSPSSSSRPHPHPAHKKSFSPSFIAGFLAADLDQATSPEVTRLLLPNRDRELAGKLRAEIITMSEYVAAFQQGPLDPDLEAELTAQAIASRDRFNALMTNQSPEYLAGFLDATQLSVHLEQIASAKQAAAAINAGIRVRPPQESPDDNTSSLEKIYNLRKEFIANMLKAAPHLAKTLFDHSIVTEDRSVRLWLENGEIRWATESPFTPYPELETVKGRFSRTHDCSGCDEEGEAACLKCLEEMDWDQLLDFAPTLGFPPIRRPKGWKPAVGVDVGPEVEAEEPTTVDDSSLLLESEVSNIGAQDRDEGLQDIEAPIAPEADKKKKKRNRKKKKKSATASTSQAGNGSQSANASSQQLDDTASHSDEGEHLTNPTAKSLHEQYQEFLPTVIPDGATFKYRPHGQPEREISAQEMRDILNEEVLLCAEEDPEFTTAVLKTMMAEISAEGSEPTKRMEGATTKAPTVASAGRAHPAQSQAKKGKEGAASKSAGMTPLEEYNLLRAQRLQLTLGIGRFVLESIRAGKRPCFDVSLDGRIEFGHADLLYPVRMHGGGSGAPNSTEVKMVTAPVININDRETPDIGGGVAGFIRDFKVPNLLAMQEMFRHVEVTEKSSVSEAKGNPVPKNNKAAVGGSPVHLGSQKYKIMLSGGPGEEGGYESVSPLATTITRALDTCEDVQTWVRTHNRNVAIRDVLGDDPLWPVDAGVPRRSTVGGGGVGGQRRGGPVASSSSGLSEEVGPERVALPHEGLELEG